MKSLKIIFFIFILKEILYSGGEPEIYEKLNQKYSNEMKSQKDNKLESNGCSWNGDEYDRKTSRDEHIKNALSFIAKANDKTLIMESSIDKKYGDLKLEKVSYKKAFEVILQQNNLEYNCRDNLIYVYEHKERELIHLKYLTPKEVQKLVDNDFFYLSFGDIVDTNLSLYKNGEDNNSNYEKAIFIKAKKETIDNFKFLLNQFEEEAKKKNLPEIVNPKKIVIEKIPLNYINVSSNEIDFNGQKIQVNSLEDTLKDLLQVENNKTSTTIIKVDKRTNSVIVNGTFEDVEKIEKLVKELDKPEKLIEVEVTIVRGAKGFAKQLGVRLGGTRKYDNGEFGVSSSESIANNLNALRQTNTYLSTTETDKSLTTQLAKDEYNSGLNQVSLLQPLTSLGLSSSLLFLGDRSSLNVQIDAMAEDNLAKILSSPHIITLNHREATITSGNSVSIPTATVDKMGLETINTGISIRVTPHMIIERNITKNSDIKKLNKKIMLQILVENSSLGSVTSEKIETSRSQINTNAIIKDGETLILGGLFEYSKTTNDGGIPILKDLPILGALFSTKGNSENRNEILFFITPRILKDDLIDRMQNKNSLPYEMGKYDRYKKELESIKNESNNTIFFEKNTTTIIKDKKIKKQNKIPTLEELYKWKEY